MKLTVPEQTMHKPSNDRDVLVRVEKVSKKFCRSLKKSLWYGVQDIATEFTGRKTEHALRPDEFWAVNDVSFELRRGECLGLIGRNGAGKSTLLRMLNGLIKPDRGYIELNGQVGGLIALGAGFNPILTGRENVYVNGSILGLSKKEIDARFDEIVDFSELEEFIDAPVHGYSSGMNVRLGFAVAAILLKPDILLLDEVLAVGDIGFTIKCLNAVRKISADSTVIFVSHNMQFVSLFCTKTLVMAKGHDISGAIPTAQGIAEYLRRFSLQGSVSGQGFANVSNVRLLVEGSEFGTDDEPKVLYGVTASLQFELEVAPSVEMAEVVLELFDPLKVEVAIAYLGQQQDSPYFVSSGKHRVTIDLGRLELNAGRYAFIIGVIEPNSGNILHRSDCHAPFTMMLNRLTWGQVVRFTPYQVSSAVSEIY